MLLQGLKLVKIAVQQRQSLLAHSRIVVDELTQHFTLDLLVLAFNVLFPNDDNERMKI